MTGKEAFRRGPGTVSKALVSRLLQGGGYQWVLLEVPNGCNIESDGTVLGVCCFTTDGVCRKNGEDMFRQADRTIRIDDMWE